MAAEEHYTVIVKVSRSYQSATHTGPQRATEDVVNMSVRADSKNDAIEKAIRLIETEKSVARS